MLKRQANYVVGDRLNKFPAVALFGPRQCGKTTLARALSNHYFDLEKQSDRLKLDFQWHEIVSDERLVVFDEAHNFPEIFPRLRSAIDLDRKRNGRFLLLGSISPALMTQVSESLAGRLAIVELTPFLITEVRSENRLVEVWFKGGYADGGILGGQKYPDWQSDYLNVMTHRDLPNWGMPARPQTTRRLIEKLAAVHGQEWNASQMGTNLGLSYHTVNTYVDNLEGAFLVRRLPAYYANIEKRLIKRPKLYWRDSGLLHSLLEIETFDSLFGHQIVGASWKGFVINQILSFLHATGGIFSAYHFRTSDQREIDLILNFDSKVWAIDIKLTSQPYASDLKKLNENADLVDADKRVLLCSAPETIENPTQMICGLEAFLELIGK